MVQVLVGVESFDAFPSLRSAARTPMDMLPVWMAFVPQITVAPELLAFSYAVEATRYELEAFFHYDQAASWLAAGSVQGVSFTLSWLEAMHYDVGRACWHWQQASKWLTNYGDPSSQKPYTVLVTESAAHQQRLLHLGEGLRQFVTWLSQEWQVAVPETMRDGWPTEETGVSNTSQV